MQAKRSRRKKTTVASLIVCSLTSSAATPSGRRLSLRQSHPAPPRVPRPKPRKRSLRMTPQNQKTQRKVNKPLTRAKLLQILLRRLNQKQSPCASRGEKKSVQTAWLFCTPSFRTKTAVAYVTVSHSQTRGRLCSLFDADLVNNEFCHWHFNPGTEDGRNVYTWHWWKHQLIKEWRKKKVFWKRLICDTGCRTLLLRMKATL